MFIEPSIGRKNNPEKKGQIEVICGSMFSGKTEELIRRLNRAKIARQKVEIFKPSIDKRYHEEDVVSHNENSIRSTPVNFAEDILLLSGNCDVVGIDEVQFFDDQIVTVAQKLANQGKRVILAGLDMDFEGLPFEPMPKLMAVAEFVTKVHAICMKCGDLAAFSLRLSDARQKVMLGEKDSYEARCRKCFFEDKK
ncbi:MAG TPA: thymidine kinase [Algoriphagus sp.]|jgi:thymidine kinase|uniref:thymidine kinase n=1 Tax=unclassified Algoriphagus TaxID=2641541 RepID=UPI000C5D04AB|nr:MULTISPECIES: thymidine kinase [unclassified Algoriphagus]MAL12390.1 thymidine kinase [Algoriphagus sp.]HAD52153.1 thymidine kinase [Algoriphagus sp.]HAH37394.1 thymidine kinase [Algoriphagus sp.]HAS59287.1 thymidine kinase [Algoriphagus sp.]HAZ25057.1 thymidine kinase [Algoriphagus sp.]|tara:strand:+ start:2227 stop:2811 length:585 start_codon:yes stop_codon:yes gene_type:complete